jgi:uncharacterized protein
MTHTEKLIVLVSLVAGGMLSAGPVSAEPIPEDATWSQIWFPSLDGTLLRADVFLPKVRAPDERHPVILQAGPYFASGAIQGGYCPGVPDTGVCPAGEEGPYMDSRLAEGGRIFSRGYAYVQVDTRGWGGSQGCNDLGGPNEQMDMYAAIEWAAQQPWSNGNVGTWGISSPGWSQIMAMAMDPPSLKAAVVMAPIIDGYRGFWFNGLHYAGDWWGTPLFLGAYDLFPQGLNDPTPEQYLYPTMGTAMNPDCYAENAVSSAQSDPNTDYWRARNLIERAGASEVAVLWSHGANDNSTKPNNFLPVYQRLRGPKRAWFGQWGHDIPHNASAGRPGVWITDFMNHYERYLKGVPVAYDERSAIQDTEGVWRSEVAWPPADAQPLSIPLRHGSYLDINGSSATAPQFGTWTFTTPAPYDVRFAGEPHLSLQAATLLGRANLVAILYDVDPNGSARLLSRGAYLLNGSGTAEIDMYPQDAILRTGHRLGLFVAGDDSSWFTSPSSGTTVTLTGGTLTLGALKCERVPDLTGGPASAMGSVPVTTVDPATIATAQVMTAFPKAKKPGRGQCPN